MRQPWISTASFVVALAVMVMAATTTSDSAPRSVEPWGLIVLVVPSACSALAWTWPRVAVIAAPVSLFGCFATFTPAFPISFGAAIPLYVAGLRGHLRWGASCVGGMMLAEVGYRLMLEEGDTAALSAVLDAVRDSTLVVALLLLGATVRARAAAERQRDLEFQVRDADNRRRLTDQRLATARELHDVLAHTLTVVTIQANVAAETFDADPPAARRAINRLQGASGEALADLRGTVALLRSPESDPDGFGAPAPGLADIPDLIDRARESGIEVALDGLSATAGLRDAVGLAVYRVVQEALTNVLRHSGARRAVVCLSVDPQRTTVTVTDDGTRQPGPPGLGLNGMTERVEALGGSLDYGSRADGGFTVTARFPHGGRT